MHTPADPANATVAINEGSQRCIFVFVFVFILLLFGFGVAGIFSIFNYGNKRTFFQRQPTPPSTKHLGQA
jgi:hypothetical protein